MKLWLYNYMISLGIIKVKPPNSSSSSSTVGLLRASRGQFNRQLHGCHLVAGLDGVDIVDRILMPPSPPQKPYKSSATLTPQTATRLIQIVHSISLAAMGLGGWLMVFFLLCYFYIYALIKFNSIIINISREGCFTVLLKIHAYT